MAVITKGYGTDKMGDGRFGKTMTKTIFSAAKDRHDRIGHFGGVCLVLSVNENFVNIFY